MENYLFMSCFLFVFTQSSLHYFFFHQKKNNNHLSFFIFIFCSLAWTQKARLEHFTLSLGLWPWPGACLCPQEYPVDGPCICMLRPPQAPPVSPCVVLRCVPACVVCAGPWIICPRAANCLPSHHNVFTLALSAPVQFWSLPLPSCAKSGPSPRKAQSREREAPVRNTGGTGGYECFRNLFKKSFSFLLWIYLLWMRDRTGCRSYKNSSKITLSEALVHCWW